MNELTKPRKAKSIEVAKQLHPRVIAGTNGTVTGVHALAQSLNNTKLCAKN